MFEGIKRSIQDVRYGDVARRKKWLVAATCYVLGAVVFFWIFLFGIQTAVSQKEASKQENSMGSLTEFWGTFKNSMQYAGQAFTASIGLINNMSVEEAATSTPSGIPTQSPAQSSVQLH